MLRLISIGDRFPFGRFADIHSRFDTVINFVHNELVVSLVTPEIGSGPLHIVLDLSELSSFQIVEYQAGRVIFNDSLGFNVPDQQIYQSCLDLSSVNKAGIPKQIKYIKSTLTRHSTSSALYQLLSGQALNVQSEFDKELAKQFQTAYNYLLNHEYSKSAKGFRGRGTGLTPAGDDFNAGLLQGLYVRQQTEKKELSKIRASIYTNSLGKNLIVNTFLQQAAHGWYDEKWLNLMTAISGQQDGLESALQAVLKQGETSGADTLTGFLAAWEIKI